MKLFRLLNILMVCLSLTIVSCSGEDGQDGVNGIDGIDGQDGANGQDGADGNDGQDGTNGLGFDELTKYGYITLEMEGTRADNVAFQDSTSFRFTPTDSGNLDVFNDVSEFALAEDITQYTFNILRFLSAPDDVYQETTLDINFTVTNPGGDNESIDDFSIDINQYAVVGDDNIYFTMDDFFSQLQMNDLAISDIVYDAETKHLTFSYAFSVAGTINDTGNDLNISGQVDVTLLEELQTL